LNYHTQKLNYAQKYFFTGQLVFNQLLSYISRSTANGLVKKHKADRHSTKIFFLSPEACLPLGGSESPRKPVRPLADPKDDLQTGNPRNNAVVYWESTVSQYIKFFPNYNQSKKMLNLSSA
jgi:hypothetical protein